MPVDQTARLSLPVLNERGLRPARQESRRLCLASLPPRGNAISHLDMDMTASCNLKCTYCFKEKSNRHLPLQTARDAVIWLIHASDVAERISIALIGGEPLMKFDTIQQLVPFAMRRAAQHDKEMRFSATTNGTLINDEILRFFRDWNIGFHTSIDGHPAVQDRHRVFKSGRGSSSILEKTLPRILSIRPRTTARSTVMPDTVREMSASYEYFRKLGYVNIAFVTADPRYWKDEDVGAYEEELVRVVELCVRDMRAGIPVRFKYIDELVSARREERTTHLAHCGAGRGMALIDVGGNIWPCHRWNDAVNRDWRLGNIYEPGFRQEVREQFYEQLVGFQERYGCERCEALLICGGGCPAENLENAGGIWARHPKACELVRATARVVTRAFNLLYEEKNPVLMAFLTEEEPGAARNDRFVAASGDPKTKKEETQS